MKLYPVIGAMLAGLAAIAAPAVAGADAKRNWTATVTVEKDGTHVLGNPDAKTRISEFVSYTCSHCADFERASDAPLRLAYVMPGKAAVRVVHLVRDPVDLTAAMLVNCGDPNGFFARHHMFLASQDKWIGKADSVSEAQQARWNTGDFPSRMRAIASDFGFYDMMAHRGFSRVDVDRCLADPALTNRIIAQRDEANRLDVPGTPSFAIGDTLLDSVHDWPSLDAALKAAH